MKKELDEKLCTKYPKIFVDRHADIRSTAMCWGIECGDGWYWLIDNLCASIQGYLDNNPHLKIPQVVTDQVKQKYGGLRFYFHGGDTLVEGMTWLAQHMSYRICEECGSTENVTQTTGWIVTLCERCHERTAQDGR
jgi:hypothetical protein